MNSIEKEKILKLALRLFGVIFLFVVTADCNVIHPVRVKVDHLSENGGFGTAHADSGASSGSEGVEASGQEHPGDCTRDGAVAGDGAAVFAGSGSNQALRASGTTPDQAGRTYRVS